MANWLNQLQSLLGQKGSSASSSGEQGLSKLLVPGALGGLAGLLVANKSSRKLLSNFREDLLATSNPARPPSAPGTSSLLSPCSPEDDADDAFCPRRDCS